MSFKALSTSEIINLADSIEIFYRGQAYYRSEAVYNFSAQGTQLKAKVSGNHGDYNVKVTQDPKNMLEGRCDCPYEDGVCKHIIAVLLYHQNEATSTEVAAEEPLSGTEKVENLPSALVQTLQEMSPSALLDLIIKLCDQNEDFKSAILGNITIPMHILNQQSPNAKLVKKLKKDIIAFFTELKEYEDHEYDYDYDHRYSDDESQDSPTMKEVWEIVPTLHTSDQLELYWQIVVSGHKASQEYVVGESEIKTAIEGYAEAVGKSVLTPQDRQIHIDLLVKACSWSINSVGSITEALKAALDRICSTEADLRYLVGCLKVSLFAQVNEWLAEYYLKLGEDAKYLRIRHKNLEFESQYLDLAKYWQSRGDETKYLKTLEDWVAGLATRERQTHYGNYSGSERPRILDVLATHYQNATDDKNLCRVMLVQAEYGNYSLELYKQIKIVSLRLNQWTKHQPILLKQAGKEPKLLAQIYLYEEQWEQAIELTQQLKSSPHQEAVNLLVAEGITRVRPQAAIQIYKKLAEGAIGLRDRRHYAIAAQHLAQAKTVYLSILKDAATWQRYIEEVRKTYKRYPALQDELRKL